MSRWTCALALVAAGALATAAREPGGGGWRLASAGWWRSQFSPSPPEPPAPAPEADPDEGGSKWWFRLSAILSAETLRFGWSTLQQ